MRDDVATWATFAAVMVSVLVTVLLTAALLARLVSLCRAPKWKGVPLDSPRYANQFPDVEWQHEPTQSPRSEQHEPAQHEPAQHKPAQHEPAQHEPAQPPRGAGKQKQHVFLLLGRDYYQRRCKLSSRTVTAVAHVRAALQELFAQELFAHELVAGGGGRLRVDEMEIQFLDGAGRPAVVSEATPVASVLAASALLVSDRPIAELTSAAQQELSQELHARPCGEPGAPARRKARRGPRRLSDAARVRLLEARAAGAADGGDAAGDDGDDDPEAGTVGRGLGGIGGPDGAMDAPAVLEVPAAFFSRAGAPRGAAG